MSRSRFPVRAVVVLPADPAVMRIGGIASFVRSFVRFAPEDFELSMVGVSQDRPIGRWSQVELEGRPLRFWPVVRADTRRRPLIPLALQFAAGLARRGRPDGLESSIVQFHRPGSDLAFRRSGAARVRFVHLTTTDLTQAGAESRWRRLGRLLARVERDSLRHMDRVYVVNSAAAQAYRDRWPELRERINFLPNFYDDTVFGAVHDERRLAIRASVRASLGLPADARVVLFCGRLEGQKDPDLLIDAFSELRSAGPGVALVVVGDGALAGDVRSRVRDHRLESDVRLLGTQARERVNELMIASDVLVITSRFETGPTVGYEAMATGLPVVTTPVGEVAGIVAQSGAGRVAADRRPVAVADAVRELLRADQGRLRGRARSAAEPFAARTVLGPVYDWHREVSSRS